MDDAEASAVLPDSTLLPVDIEVAAVSSMQLGDAPEAPADMVAPAVVHLQRRTTSFDASVRAEVAAAYLRSEALVYAAG